MIPGASLGPPSPPSNRNKKPIQARSRRADGGCAMELAPPRFRNWGPPAVGELGERNADTLVAAPDPTAAADELIGLDLKRK